MFWFSTNRVVLYTPVYYHSRLLHLSNVTLVRKVAQNRNRTFKSDIECLVSKEENSNVNFWGIENDFGVITLEPQSDNIIIDQNASPVLKEKFLRTSFGVVRSDSNNYIRYHGQYDKYADLTFPRKSNEYFTVTSSTKVSSTLFDSASKKYTDEISSNQQIEQNIIQNEIKCGQEVTIEEKSSSNFMGKCFSLNIDYKKAKTVVENNNKNVNVNNEVNQIDFFATNKEKCNNVESKILQDDCEDLHFIDEHYFGHESVSKKDIEKNKSHEVKELNYIDKHYFQNIATLQENDNREFCADENISLMDKEKEFNKNQFDDEITVNVESKFFHNSGQSISVASNNINIDETFNNKFGMSENIKEKDEYKCENSSFVKSEYTQGILDNLSKPPFNVVNLQSQFKKKIKASNEKQDSIKNYEIHTNKQSDSDSQLTAHEFISKLPNENAYKLTKAGVKSLKEEKQDSKGFRILTNQIPDLSLFTRDEILGVLKNNVLYSDNELLVLNKPYGLVVHDSKTTKDVCLSLFLEEFAKMINPELPDSKLFTVHRLDKETTGCIILARNQLMADNLKSLFAQRKIIKKYWIVTSRVPEELEGIINIPISEGTINGKKRMVLHPVMPKDIPYRSHSKHGKHAITAYKVLATSGNAALVEVTPKTGVKHQIRVHFGFGLSCPILGDHKYSYLDKLVPQKLPSDILQKLHVRQSKVRYVPMHIHARSIAIPSYNDGQDLFVMAPLPFHMKINLKRLKFKKNKFNNN